MDDEGHGATAGGPFSSGRHGEAKQGLGMPVSGVPLRPSQGEVCAGRAPHGEAARAVPRTPSGLEGGLPGWTGEFSAGFWGGLSGEKAGATQLEEAWTCVRRAGQVGKGRGWE
jgi:hypothetical protein